MCCTIVFVFFFQAEDGIRDAQESRGLGDVYKRQDKHLFLDQREQDVRQPDAARTFGHAGIAGDAAQQLSLIHI